MSYNAKQRFLELVPAEHKPKPGPDRKQWSLTKNIPRYKKQDTYNIIVERAFMLLLDKVKQLYQGSGTLAFDFDMRRDNEFNATSMHCFCTNDLYLELECTYELKCQVNYDFENGKHQNEVLAFIAASDTLKKATKHLPLKGSVSAFFERVKQIHSEARFIEL